MTELRKLQKRILTLIHYTHTNMLKLPRNVTLVLVTVVFIGSAYVIGYLSGVFGYSAIDQAKAYTVESQKNYTESNAMYDKAQKLACKSHGLIVADCFAGNKEACSLMVTSENTFLANFSKSPQDVCGL